MINNTAVRRRRLQINHLFHVRLFTTTTTSLTEIFLRESKNGVETAVFLIDGA